MVFDLANDISRELSYKILKGYWTSDVSNINIYLNNHLEKNINRDCNNRFVSNLCLGTIRLHARYDYILKILYNGNYDKLDIGIKIILRMGLHQIEDFDTVPDYASINSTVDMIKKYYNGFESTTNALMRNYLRKKSSINNFSLTDEYEKISALLSMPLWIFNKWVKKMSLEEAIDLCHIQNKKPKIWFRVNNQKICKNIPGVDFFNEERRYFSVDTRINELLQSDSFKYGDITVQNPTNGYIVDLLDLKEGETVIDVCSAPGGKFSLICSLIPNTKVFGFDINEKRLEKQKKSLKRQKIKNYESSMKDALESEFPYSDKILLDVPCSGTGVMSRRADLRWNRSREDLVELNKIQIKMLENCSKYVKDKGRMVYSTCSIEEEENELIVENFLSKNKNFRLISPEAYIPKEYVKDNFLSIFPNSNSLDGGFAAIMEKNA